MNPQQDDRQFDPICGMQLARDEIAVTLTYIGRTYAFCCQECLTLFLRSPESHIVRLAHNPDESVAYRCPYQHHPMTAAWLRDHGLAPVVQPAPPTHVPISASDPLPAGDAPADEPRRPTPRTTSR